MNSLQSVHDVIKDNSNEFIVFKYLILTWNFLQRSLSIKFKIYSCLNTKDLEKFYNLISSFK